MLPESLAGRPLAVEAVLLFLSFFLCITFDYATKSVRQAALIDTLGAAKLPYVYLLRLYGRRSERLARHRVIAGGRRGP